jgi:glycosyltransferase involved in cell wall biosynthesis
VTVHDLAVFRHPEAFPRWTRTYAPNVVPRVLRAARSVIAVSEFTASELETILHVPREKIHVVPNAVDDTFMPNGPRADGDYVLAVGTLEPRKNLARAIEAAARIGVDLRVVGASGWGGVEARGENVTWLGSVDDDELARQYRGALCVIYPSVYEGFGLPVLEAMACGAAVVTSAGGATAEVAGDAALLVDPLDVGAIAGGIETAIASREALRLRGIERARAFSWDEAARLTQAVYEEAA